jgi:hypothetical protein
VGGPFTPPAASALKARWIAGSGTFQDSALTTPAAADTDPVGGWVDTIAGRAATQATAGQRPTLALNAFGSYPGILFNSASSQFLQADSLGATFAGTDVPYTWISVYRLTANGVAAAFLSAGRASSANPYTLFQVGASNILGGQRRNDAATATVTAPVGANIVDKAPRIAAMSFDGATVTCYENGAMYAGPAAYALASAETLDEFSIGVWRRQNTINASFMAGYHAEHAVYNVALTADQVLAWSKYAASHYGITLNS